MTRQMSEPERAWLAAVIDTDGCIGIGRESPGSFHSIGLQLTGNVGEGRILHEYAGDITGTGCTARGQWCISSQKEIYFILQQVMPYLLLKQELAEAICDYLETRLPKSGGSAPYDNEDEEKWMKVLDNRRGSPLSYNVRK